MWGDLLQLEAPNTAATAWNQGCQRGHAPGCLALANHLWNRSDRDNSIALIESLAMRACDADLGRGCLYLGFLHSQDAVPNASDAVAIERLRQACDLREGAGCTQLAIHLAQGIGVEPDPRQAFALFRDGCGLDDGLGCPNAGLMLLRSLPFEDGGRESGPFFARGCARDQAESCVRLAEIYAAGRGVPAVAGAASSLAARACEVGAASGCALKRSLRDAEPG